MRIFALVLSVVAAPVFAHELWIEPLDFEPDSRVVAHLVNGQEFEGTELIYMERSTARLEVHLFDQAQDIAMRLGDKPAISVEPLGTGLHVLVYQSAPASLTYRDWQKFQDFSDHKDLAATLEAHQAAGYPEDQFKEVYTRFSKSLVSVGSPDGADSYLGMEAELVALDNPYTSDELSVQLLYQGEPLADTQVEVFAKTDAVEISLIRTDATGVATLALEPGVTYMLDAVILRTPDAALAAETGAVYETLWANLTFHVPE